MSEPASASFRHTLQLLCTSLMGSQVVLLLAVCGLLGADGFSSPALWALAVVVVAGAAAGVAIPAVGFRTAPLPPAADEAEAGLLAASALRSTTVVRFAMAEAVALVAVALGIVTGDGGALVCLLGVAVSLTLTFLFVWPGDSSLRRLRASLEAGGGHVDLDELLDAPPPRRGA